jgi:asparagine synthetase B (glutamine-hydrolysing)
MLRPMANLFAVTDADPSFLDHLEERLAASGEFDCVWRPADGWVAAQASLPEAEPDGDAVHARGFAFVEGRDRLQGGPGLEWLDRVAELADRIPGGLAELPGDFGFVRFRRDGSALAVRSCGGLAPLYLHRRDGGGLALGTLLNYFPRFIPARFHADPLINASWELGVNFINGRTFLERVAIVPRASHTELRFGAAPRTSSYWDPRPDVGDEPEPSPEHPRQLRDILIETLSRDLDPRGRNLLCLSGGVDSSSVGALAAGTIGRHLSSWSMIPPMEPEGSRERSYIDSLVSQFGIEPAHRLGFTEELHRSWITTAPGLPFQIMNQALCDLPRISSQQDVRVFVDGIFADEVCGHQQRMPDWLDYTSLWSLLTEPVPFGRRDYTNWTRRRLRRSLGIAPRRFRYGAELPGWARPEAEADHRDWMRRRREARGRDHRPLGELADLVAADGWVAMNWEGTAPLGIRRSLPFFNREVLELAFRCHPRELLGPGPKRILREALRDDVPARHLMRPDKAVWRPHLVTARWPVDAPLPAVAEALVSSEWLSHPPSDVSFNDGLQLAYAIRVARYLEGPPDGFGSSDLTNRAAPNTVSGKRAGITTGGSSLQ